MAQWDEGTEGFDSSGLLTDPYDMFTYKGKQYFKADDMRAKFKIRHGTANRYKKYSALYEMGALTPNQVKEFKAWREKMHETRTREQKPSDKHKKTQGREWWSTFKGGPHGLSFNLNRARDEMNEPAQYMSGTTEYDEDLAGVPPPPPGGESGKYDTETDQEKEIRKFQGWWTEETTRGGRGQLRKSFLELMRNTREKYSSFRDRLASGWGY